MRRILNGQLADLAAEMVEPVDGEGVFESLRFVGDNLRFFEEHWRRFVFGCAFFELIAPAPAHLLTGFRQLREEARLDDGVLRWSAWRGAEGRSNWQLTLEPPRPHMAKPHWSVALSAITLPAADEGRACKRLARAPWREALRMARAGGFDETLLFDASGRLVEGAVSNIFCVAAGTLLTPPLADGPLPGVARGQVLVLARDLGLEVREESLGRADLTDAAEFFLTNSLVGLRPVADLAGRAMPAPGPVTARLQAAWRERHGPL